MKSFQSLIEEIDNFIRDEHGKPVPYYHGTRTAFDTFKPNTKPKMQLGFGIHFTPDPTKAAHYTEKSYSKGRNPNVHKVFLKANNPLDIDKIYHKDEHPTHLALHHALHKGTGRQPYIDRDGNFVVNPDVTNPGRAQKIIQQHGFDAVKYKARELTHSGHGLNVADKYDAVTVFHPDQIHHAYGK